LIITQVLDIDQTGMTFQNLIKELLQSKTFMRSLLGAQSTVFSLLAGGTVSSFYKVTLTGGALRVTHASSSNTGL